MIEILYDPKLNTLFLFTGKCKLDLKRKIMTAYVYTENSNKHMFKHHTKFVHIGWL